MTIKSSPSSLDAGPLGSCISPEVSNVESPEVSPSDHVLTSERGSLGQWIRASVEPGWAEDEQTAF